MFGEMTKGPFGGTHHEYRPSLGGTRIKFTDQISCWSDYVEMCNCTVLLICLTGGAVGRVVTRVNRSHNMKCLVGLQLV